MRVVSLFSSALRVPHAAWVRFWTVDATVASRFPSLEEYEEELERAREHNRQLTRRVYTEYAKSHILPRLSMGSGLLPMVQPRAAETESGLSPLNFVLVVTVLAFTPLLLVKLAKKALKESNPELWALWEKQQLISAPKGVAAVNGAAPSNAPSLLQPPSTPILRSDLAKHRSVEDRVHALEALVLELKSKKECVEPPTPPAHTLPPPTSPPPPPLPPPSHAVSAITPPSTTP